MNVVLKKKIYEKPVIANVVKQSVRLMQEMFEYHY